MEKGFDFVAHGGRYVFVGVIKGSVTFMDPDFHRKEMALFGSRNATSEDFERVIAAIVQEGMLALEDVVVGAADTDPARTNQGMPGTGPRGGSLLQLQAAWSRADKRVYELHGTRSQSQEWAPIASGGGGPAQGRPLRSLTGSPPCCPS